MRIFKNNLKKVLDSIPQESKEGVIIYLGWQESRTRLNKLTKKDEVQEQDIIRVKNSCENLINYINTNGQRLINLKIDTNKLNETLNADLNYCKLELELINKVERVKNDKKD